MKKYNIYYIYIYLGINKPQRWTQTCNQHLQGSIKTCDETLTQVIPAQKKHTKKLLLADHQFIMTWKTALCCTGSLLYGSYSYISGCWWKSGKTCGNGLRIGTLWICIQSYNMDTHTHIFTHFVVVALWRQFDLDFFVRRENYHTFSSQRFMAWSRSMWTQTSRREKNT